MENTQNAPVAQKQKLKSRLANLFILGSLVFIGLLSINPVPPAGAIEAQPIYVLEKQVSVKGQPIPIYRYGKGETEYVFLFAGFHGNEPQGPFMLEQLMQVLENNPGYYHDKSIFVVPRVNPDALISKRRTNANHVDLNRNFPTQNFIPGANQGTSYYAGQTALSEPETQIVYELLSPFTLPESRLKTKILSIHAPYATNNYDGPARPLAEAMKAFNRYRVSVDIGYPTPGSFGTYYGKEKGLRVITLETENSSPQAAWKRQEKALLAFLQFPSTELYPPEPTPSPGSVEAFILERAE